MRLHGLVVVTAIGALCSANAALGHIPIFSSDGAGTEAANAVFIDDASISHAVYHELTDATPQLWVTFELEAGQEIYAQFGIPVLDRLVEFRPAFAVLGPGLPEIDLPFDTPDGLGGILFSTDDIEEPEYFYERFTATESWIFGEIVDAAPETGTYFLVAYVPTGEPGKLWAAPGRREVFEPQDIAALPALVPQVREFHEVEDPDAVPCFLFPATGLAATACLLMTTRRLRRRRPRPVA